MGGRELLRHIPQVDRLLTLDAFSPLIEQYSRAVVLRHVQADLESLREEASHDRLEEEQLGPDSIRGRVTESLEASAVPYYQRVVNATGVVLHTGLGRAPLSTPAVQALAHEVGHPVRVEIDLVSGERGGRDEGCAALLRELTGAEAATVVNNNAGATLLVLAALARGKRVLLSRGEMVEIGGSYRVPEIMEEGGAILHDVGTTNRTHVRDYEKAITDETGMILKVHTSNYKVQGFTKEVEIEELVSIGRAHDIPVVHDLGSGSLLDLGRHGLADEPHVLRSVAAGADLTCFSGDKLLGGPQAGIIVGTEEAVQRCRKHPLFRALRPGRLTYVALESTLRIYQQGEAAVLDTIPAMGRLLASPETLRHRAEQLASMLRGLPGITVEVRPDFSQAGSGSLPARDLATSVVAISAAEQSNGTAPRSAVEVARHLRTGYPSILPRMRDDAVLLDVRTIDDDEFEIIEARLRETQ